MSFERRAVRASYDAVAAEYAEAFGAELDASAFDRDQLDLVAARCRPGDRLLDVGCGPWQVGAYLAHHGVGVVATDLSSAMARLAQARAPAVVAACADVLALPFATASFSAVTVRYVLQHLPRPRLVDAARELARVVHPAGTVLVATHLGEGDVHLGDWFGRTVDLSGALHGEDEVVAALRAGGLAPELAQRREHLPGEFPSQRLYLHLRPEADRLD